MFPAVSWASGQDRLIFKLARFRFGKTIVAGRAAMAVALAAVSVLAQQKPAPQIPAAGIEFPVLMQQNVAAGKTIVGSKIQAKLVIATLVKGTVIPEGAILSGEVTESVAKSLTASSRLGVRMDSAQWKNGSLPIRVYLTAWYYPVAMLNPELSPGGPDGSSPPTGRTVSKLARNSQPTSLPGSDVDVAPLPAASIAQHRVLMRNVESTRNRDGAITLTSNHSNLKLDRTTTYVLVADGLVPTK